MSKKRKNSPKVPDITYVPNSWIPDLGNKFINDEHFKCEISIVVESREFYRCLSQQFDEFSQYGYRKCIKCISMDGVTEFVFKNSSRNGAVTPLSLLCDEVLKSTGKFFQGKIPLDLYAYLIKYIILDFKERKIVENNVELLKESQFQNLLNQYTKVVGSKGVKSKGEGKPASKAKTSSAKKSGKKSGNKGNDISKPTTELNTRNENLKCLENVKDEPEGSPDMFVVIIQSQNSELPLKLIKLQIPVTSIIQLGYLDTDSFDDNDSFLGLLTTNYSKNKQIEQVLNSSFLERSENRSFLDETPIRKYWTDILYFMNTSKYSKYFKNVVILKCIPEMPDASKPPKSIDHLRRLIYDSISYTLYESVLLRKIYKRYTKEVNLVQVSGHNDKNVNEFEYYNKIMDNLSLEDANVAIILDTLTSQVCLDLDSYIGYNTDDFRFLRRDDEVEMPLPPPLSCMDTLIQQLTIDNRFSDYNLNFNPNYDKFEEDSLKNTTEVYCYGDPTALSSLKTDIKEFLKNRTIYIQKLFWDALIFSTIDQPHFMSNLCKKYKDEILKDLTESDILDIFLSLLHLKDEFLTERLTVSSCQEFEHCQQFVEEIKQKIHPQVIMKYFPDKFSKFNLLRNSTFLELLENIYEDSSHLTAEYVKLNDKWLLVVKDVKIPLTKSVQLPTILSLQNYAECVSENHQFESDKIFIKDKKRFNYSELLLKEINASVINLKEASEICNMTKYHGAPENWVNTNYDESFDNISKYKYYLVTDKNYIKEERDLKNGVLYDVGLKGKIIFNFYDMNIKLNQGLEVFLRYLEELKFEKYELNLITKVRQHEIHYWTNILPFGFHREKHYVRTPHLLIRHSSQILISFQCLNKNSKQQQNSNSTNKGGQQTNVINLSNTNNETAENNFNFSNINNKYDDWPNLNFLNNNITTNYDKRNVNVLNKDVTTNGDLSNVNVLNKDVTTNGDLPNVNVFNKDVTTNGDLPNLNLLNDEKYKSDLINSFKMKISWPNGLMIEQINLLNTPSYIRQAYLEKTPTHFDIAQESSRCYLYDGTVIKFMENGSFIVYSSGKVINCYKYESIEHSETDADNVHEVDVNGVAEFLKLEENSTVAGNLTLEYDLRRQDGRLFYVENDVVIQKGNLFVEDFHDIQECSIKSEFSDGITYLFTTDGSLTVYYTDGTVVTTYSRFSNGEIIIRDEDINSEEELKPKKFLLDFAEEIIEPFVVVELCYKIEHPNFAAVVFSYSGEQAVLTMHDNIQITLSNNIHINFNNHVQIATGNNSIIVNEFNKDKVRNEIRYCFGNFSKRNEHCVKFDDCFNNSILVYDNGKFEVNDKKELKTKQQEHVFVVDRNYSSIQILSKFNFNQNILKFLNDNPKAVYRELRTPNSVDCIILNPLIKNKWGYFDNFINLEKNPVVLSTYGKYWFYPFKKMMIKKERQPEILCVQYYKEIINIESVIKNIENILGNICLLDDEMYRLDPVFFTEIFSQFDKIIHDFDYAVKIYEQDTVKLEKECMGYDLYNYLKNKLLDKTVQRINTENIDVYSDRYGSDKINILNNFILPYFSNAEGTVNVIMNELIDDVYFRNKYEKKLGFLVYKTLAEVSDQDITNIISLFVKTKRIPDDEDVMRELNKVLKAGRTLKKYFANVNQVLEFHMTVKMMNISDDIFCN